VELSFDEIAELSAYTDKSHPDRLRKDLLEVRDKVLSCQFHYETDEVDRKGNLFSTFDILKTKPKAKIKVNKDFQDFFNALASEFTMFELEQYVSLDGIYAKNLYRLLKQWKKNGCTQKYSVDEIIELLGTPDYKPMKLKQKIIDPAVDEIKQKKAFSNLWCEVVYARKRGKPVDGYIFHFRKDEVEGQISIETLDGGKYMPDSKPEKPARKKSKATNKFNNFPQRKYSDRYYELFEKMNAIGLTAEEQKELVQETKNANAR